MILELTIGGILGAAIALAAFFRARIPRPIKIETPHGRWALLYRLSGGARATLVVLHSYSGDAFSTAKYSGFLQAAMLRGFNVVVPEGVGHEWHDSPDETPRHDNDVEFISSLVEKLIADHIADPRLVFIAGISNGGMMAFTILCARPDLFAGIATVSAGMPRHLFENCGLIKPMPLIMINGDADDVLAYRGGDVGYPAHFFRRIAGVEATAGLFARANGCAAAKEPRRSKMRDGKRQIEQIEWDCPGGVSVTVIKVIGGSHDTIGWRAPWQVFFGWPPRGPATAAAVVQRFAQIK